MSTWRSGEQQRHPHLLVEHRGAVVGTAVLAELLTVIRGQHEEHPLAALPDGVDQAADLGVHVGDLRVVPRRGGPPEAAVSGPHQVGLVGIEVVCPHKHRLGALGVPVTVEKGDDLICAPPGGQVLVFELEVLKSQMLAQVPLEAPAVDGEHRQRVEAGGAVPGGRPEDLGQGGPLPVLPELGQGVHRLPGEQRHQ
jgi:hypothetical protein